MKSRDGKSQRREEKKKEDPGARKGRKFAKHCVFPMICGSGGLKSRLAKAGEPSGQMRDEKLHAVVARSTFPSQSVQNTPAPDHFGSWDVEKVHAVVARSTLLSQNAQSTSCSDHFWKLRCPNRARRCGAKHVFKSKCKKAPHVWTTFGSCSCGAKDTPKSKCTKHLMSGPLLEIEMSKKCTPLWREAHVEVNKCTKHHMVVPLLDVEASFCVAGARDSPPCQKWAKCAGFVAFSKTMAGVGHVKKICKDGFRVAGAVQETCWSEMLGGQAADFLKGVAFWSIRSSGLRRWFCVTGAALCMTSHHFFVAGAAL